MSTNSTIAVEHLDGTVSEVYCHWDGYVSYNGYILHKHYNSLELAEELISLGDISALRAKIHPNPDIEHSFDNAQNDVTVYYGRDRGEDNTAPNKYPNIKMYSLSREYNYIFKNGEWYVNNKKVVDVLN